MMSLLIRLKDWINQKVQAQKSQRPNWVEVYSGTDEYFVSIIKLKLEEEGIPVLILDQRDSSYNAFGTIHVNVPNTEVVRARFLLERDNPPQQDH